ncbi:hypothetical protein FOCC_FOCC005109 [Frankliniella occidentalis]|nr:hypothetical protein FOCC_FOCC005109 [Frankliniella occidentalis]
MCEKVFAGPILRSHQSNKVNNNEHDAHPTICIDDDDDNSNDAYLDDKNDKDFNPEGVKKTGTKKSQLSLGSNNVRRSGRKKGGKNIQPPKKSIKDELEKTKLQLKELTGAVKPAESEKLKPGPLIQTFKKAKKVPTKEDIICQLSSSAIEERFIDQIYDGCLMTKPEVTWDDIGGLEPMKISMKEMIIDPLKRPDIFRGLRAAPKGVLLYGPPGTGKTMIARCIASQCDSSFLNVSASKLTSKWVGDGEKAVQALFAVARAMQPSIIFIDEVDSMLSKRTEKENESSKKMKSEFLVQMDGAASQEADNVLVIGATNRPDDLDEAVRRRFQKRFMIPLPDNQGRLQILKAVLAHEKIALEEADFCTVANSLEGYSGADIRKVCAEASMTPVREWSGFLDTVELSEIRAIELHDLMEAAERVKPSVSLKDLSHYEDFHKLYGDKP